MNWYGKTLLAVALVTGLGTNSWAGAPTDQLRTYTDQILKVLENPGLSLPEKRATVRKIASEVFDTMETAQRVLGQHWQQRTSAEREDFAKLFANLLEQTYISRIDEYGGERLTYTSEQVDGERAVVRARIVTAKGTEVPVESRLLHKGDRWLIYDILIENLSLISNYRSQFDRVIRTSGYPELVKRLQARVEALNEKDGKAPKGAAPATR
ncbi:MAG TPA: ABC transporter substrate-binding protein [Candidatus Acidoferrales bacterium]|nr:ABC transporter substrate-binding protein [Candidatus Acidoferrales bacterium]